MDQVTKVVEGGVFDAFCRQKEISDFSTHKRVLYYAGGKAIGQSFGLSRASWRILWPWQDRSQHRFLKEKSKNRVGGGGLGWVQKVVGHMPWGALSGSPRVLGHEEVFWGCCGGFRAPVVQCMQ